MDTREILTRFKGGTLRREHAVALLAGTSPAVAPPVVALPVAADREPPPGPVPGTGVGAGVGDGAGAGVPCAVVGIQGRFPQAGDLEAFWRNGLQGRIAEAALPAGAGRRVRLAGAFPGRCEEFDPDCSGSLPGAAGLDLQERLLAQSAWQTLESAGYAGARLERLTAPTARRAAWACMPLSARPAVRCRPRAPAHRPSASRPGRPRGCRGARPARARLSVDSGDSSFLTALHLALGALRAGECAAAWSARSSCACIRRASGPAPVRGCGRAAQAAGRGPCRRRPRARRDPLQRGRPPGPRRPRPQHGRLVGRRWPRPACSPGHAPAPPDAGPQGPDAGGQSEVPDAGLEAVGSLWRRVPGRWRRWWAMPGR
ncbi:beta-ketoacyl synthase N-terminal-like domain-containing protein [Streptomyces sp. Ag82_O1-15]|uniref:beta-ketoacyl synthase N-terminal-like domain-containing protein n=1 Tax=Streptomyces sp. Ag82_O1-15 TaxID=1938855 RepID=UPI000BB0E8C5|nr:beta-ketoacyl synthase N-terminal-like domain-containing protein [Streptomyces sp. Ag82_O1-15]